MSFRLVAIAAVGFVAALAVLAASGVRAAPIAFDDAHGDFSAGFPGSHPFAGEWGGNGSDDFTVPWRAFDASRASESFGAAWIDSWNFIGHGRGKKKVKPFGLFRHDETNVDLGGPFDSDPFNPLRFQGHQGGATSGDGDGDDELRYLPFDDGYSVIPLPPTLVLLVSALAALVTVWRIRRG